MTTTTTRMAALFVLYAGLSSPAYAYLDPATGSIVIQAVVGAVGTGVVYYKLFMDKTKRAFGSIFKRNSSQD